MIRNAFRILAATLLLAAAAAAQQLTPHTLNSAPGKSIALSLPEGLDINVAASGLKRVRFFAQSPDGRIFVTGMDSLADNNNGSILILDGWNAQTHTFAHVVHYLDHLRNPNNLAFYTEPASNGHAAQSWIYIPLTDRLIRYKYDAGDNAPHSAPQTLIHFPDYGLNYKYGGWHLTRTVAIATLHGRTRVYVAAGSSCNYCREREVARAAVLSMYPDGSDQLLVAQGLRNAVDLRFVPGLDGGALFATNMGDDHLGDQLPEDTFFELDSNTHAGPIAASTPPNYGWPTCYFAHGAPVLDHTALPDTADAADKVHIAPPPQQPRRASKDSVYGDQAGMAEAGTNLAAGGNGAMTDPNASLGRAPAPLTSCEHVPAAYTTFLAHSSPLGLAYFGADDTVLRDSFLVALHGASHPHIGTGYRIVRFTPGSRRPQNFMLGFLTSVKGRPVVHGRPCGLLRIGPDSFLITDDYLGLVYSVHPSGK